MSDVIQEQLSEELERSCYVVNYEGQLHLFITHRDSCDRINGSRLLAAVRSRIPMMDVENVHMLPANYELPRSEATGKLSGPMLVDAVTKADNRKAIKKKAEDTMEDVETERMRGTALMITLALPLWSLLSHPFIIVKTFFMRLMLLPWVMRLLIHPAGEYVAYYTPFGRYGVGFVLAQLPGALGWYVYILAAIMGAFLAGKRKPIRALCWVPVSLIVQGPAMLRQDVETWIGYVTKWGVAGVSKWYVEQLEKLCNRKYYWRCSRLLHRVNSLLAVSGGSAETTTTGWTPQEYRKCSRCRRRYALNYGCSDTFYAEPWNWYCEDCWWTHIGRINESFGMDVVEPVSIGRLVGGHSSSSTCGSDTPSRGETSPSSGSTDNVVLFDSRGNSVEQKVLRILTAILGEPPTSETTLMGLSSLNVVLLTAQVNKEFGANLSVAEVMDSGTSLQVLCKRIEMAVIAAQPDDTTPLPHLVPAGGEEYAVYTNESLWTAAVCDWLLAASTPLETTRVQSAVGAIVKKHPSLRSYPADKQMDETISVLTKASAYFHLRGWGKESKFGTLLSWCVCELWPRIAVKADDEGPRVIECTYDMSEAKDVVRCTDRLWREYPFEPPFQVFLLRPASGEGANYLYIKTTHLLSDGYCVLPLVMDFERFINEPEESPVELNPYCILQKRLRDTIEMKPGIASGYNFEQQMEKWQSWDRGTIKRRTLWLEKDTVEALMVAGQDMAVSAEVMVLAVVLLSLSRFKRWSWVSLSLMQTLRDEVEYRTQDMVAFFSDYRDMGLFPTHSSNSVNDFVFELSTRIRMRKWKAHDYTLYDHSDCLVTDLDGNAVFPVVVNLIPHNSPHYRAGGSDDDDTGKRCRITNVPTYSRMMFQGAGRPSSSPMHVYIEETIPGSEWGLRFQFNEAYFDCHDVVSFVRRSVRGAIRDLTSGAGSAASSQAPHRKWEGFNENTLQ